jgi:hypothetical protein
MYYLNSESGEEIDALKYENPHPNTEAFIERIERGAIGSVGWFYELLNLSESGRAASRLVCDLANQSIWERQSAGRRRAKRAIVYAIAKGMKNGFLSKNQDGIDPYLWEFGLPKQLSVDAGNDEQADRENLKMGIDQQSHPRAEERLPPQRDRGPAPRRGRGPHRGRAKPWRKSIRK